MRSFLHLSLKTMLTALALPFAASCTLIVGGGNDIAFCGDGNLQTGEVCDDGNTSNGDGCRSDCNGEELCGDSLVDTGAGVPEQCDDGNTVSGDGCAADCRRIEECGNGLLDGNEECDDGNAANGNGSTDTCDSNCTATSCGNGVLTTSTGEECDDNTANGDGCSSSCVLEECGNGIADPGEECDDGNGANGDGCDVDCSNTACGNGIVTGATGEFCDDGNLIEGDGCDTNCTASACGNGIEDATEECDDANAISGDGCDADCTLTTCGNSIVTVGEQCDDGNNVDDDGCTNDCQQPNCGNGIVESAFNEQCDDGNLNNNDGCDGNCTLPACGNGIENAGEECDDANAVNNDGCTNACQDPSCGDGVIQLSNAEACDDGNTVSGDGCSSDCLRSEICGNNILDANEVCDDGAAINGDGCRADCQGQEECGDGLLDVGEECDDDNTANDDGCNAACVFEECGDGVINNTVETCDDGNQTAGDGCNAVCIDEFCGDGVVNNNGGEACDDGNVNNGDACENDCTLPACFNGIADPNEFCYGDSPAVLATGAGAETFASTITGDFNNDGIQDILSASTASQLHHLRGNGDGTFTLVQQIAMFGNANLALGDINNDGNLDLAGQGSTFFTVNLGNNNGLFDPQVFIDATPIGAINLRDIELLDMDNDGDDDIFLADSSGTDIFTFRSNGGGGALNVTFDNSVIFNNVNVPGGLKAADFNEDGNEDLAVLFINFSVMQIHFGNGNGTFNDIPGLPIATAAGASGRAMDVGDVNDDGHQDLVGITDGGRSVYLGDGAGNFSARIDLSDISEGASFSDAFIADINGDGINDIISGANVDLVVNTSNGDGTFNGDIRLITQAAGLGFFSQDSIAAADFNQDGVVDVVTAPGSASLQLNFGSPSGLKGEQVFRNQLFGLGDVKAADIDNDGDQDMLIVSNVQGDLLVLKNVNNAFVASQQLDFVGARTKVVGDFNEDGNLDVVVSSDVSFIFGFFAGNGDGTFDAPVVTTNSRFNFATDVGDINNDGNLDVLFNDFNGAPNGGGAFAIAFGNGDGTFQPLAITSGGIVADGIFPQLGDFDEDGDLDIAATADQPAHEAFFLPNNGDGTFPALSARTVIASLPGERPNAAKIADVNEDGNLDYIFSEVISPVALRIAFGNGDGTFQAQQPITDTTNGFITEIHAGDIDLDGDTDIVIIPLAFGAQGRPELVLSNGDGTFAADQFLDVNSDIFFFSDLADLDGDGGLDLMLVHRLNSNLTDTLNIIYSNN